MSVCKIVHRHQVISSRTFTQNGSWKGRPPQS